MNIKKYLKFNIGQNKMENGQNNYHIDPVITLGVVLELIFIIFAAVTISNILNRKTEFPKIEINNYSAIPEGKIIDGDSETSNTKDINFKLNDFAKSSIEESIYNIAALNIGDSIENNGAQIREGSAYNVYLGDLNAYFLNFIVDIEDLKQSYRFVWRRAADDSSGQVMAATSMMAFCPKEDEMIYDDFRCKDEYDGHGLDIVVYELLRYKMFSNFTVGLSGAYDGKPLSLRINTISDEEPAKNAAIQEVSDYLSSLGFNLDDFEYTVGSYVCCSLD